MLTNDWIHHEAVPQVLFDYLLYYIRDLWCRWLSTGRLQWRCRLLEILDFRPVSIMIHRAKLYIINRCLYFQTVRYRNIVIMKANRRSHVCWIQLLSIALSDLFSYLKLSHTKKMWHKLISLFVPVQFIDYSHKGFRTLLIYLQCV